MNSLKASTKKDEIRKDNLKKLEDLSALITNSQENVPTPTMPTSAGQAPTTTVAAAPGPI